MTVRVIKPPPEPQPLQTQCIRCKAVLEVEQSDCRHVSDPRDGDAYVAVCPCCSSEVWIAARLFRSRP